jgi:hypothetical protein
VPEVVGGDRRARSHQIVDRVVEDPDRPAVQVRLEVTADLVVVVAQTVRFPLISAGQQKPGRLDRTGRDDHVIRDHRASPARAADIAHQADTGDPAGGVADDPLRAGRK